MSASRKAYGRGAGRTHLMLKVALGTASSGQRVLVVMDGRHAVAEAHRILRQLADATDSPYAKSAPERIHIASVDDEVRGVLRGRSFDARFADHVLLDLPPGADWLR